MAEDPHVDQSHFNQAMFEQIRLDKIMNEVNNSLINPLAWNEHFCEFNYIIAFRALTTYFGEVSSKFSSDENKEVNKLRKTLQNCIDNLSVFKRKGSPNTLNKNPKLKVDGKVWNPLRDGLFDYQIMILKFAHKHGLGNPTKKDPRKAILN